MIPRTAIALVLVSLGLAGIHVNEARGEAPAHAFLAALDDDPPAKKNPAASTATPLPPAPAANPEAKAISDHIRARLKKSRAVWVEAGVKELMSLQKLVKDFEPAPFTERISGLSSNAANPADTEAFSGVKKKLQDDNEILTTDDELLYEKEFLAAIGKIVDEAAQEASNISQTSKPSVVAKPETPAAADVSAKAASDLLADKKAYDLFADANVNDYAKLLSAQKVSYFPGGKATTENGFDKLTPVKQIETIAKNTSDYLRKITRDRLTKAGSDKADIDLVFSPRGFESPEYQKQFEDFATEIVIPGTKPKRSLAPIDGLTEDQRKKLQDYLEAQNEKYNLSDDKKVARETKNLRAGRLLDDAREFLEKSDPLGEELGDAKLASVKQYCDRIANPNELLKSDEDEKLASSDDIDDFKSSIYGKIRELYKEMGGFGQILGVFGLKGYFAGIIADALARRLDRVLTGDEREKIDQWAASLASELHGSEPRHPQQPGNVVRYPVQTPGYPQMPYGPMVPVMPSGKWGHGAKWGGYRSGAYLVPAPGGYYVVPR